MNPVFVKPTLVALAIVLLQPWPADAQPPQGQPPPGRTYVPPVVPKTPSPVERLGKGLLRVGNVRIDTAKKEISVSGTVNDVKVLEFIATTPGGYKSYESAIELETNAINFNLGMILIGLDSAHATVPKMHLDPNPPKGDAVEVWVSWDEGGKPRRVPAEELVYNETLKSTLPAGGWVYTGSTTYQDKFVADVDGTLIGFVHSPSPVIEKSSAVPRPYGSNAFNTGLNLKPGTRVTVTVRALPASADR